MPLPGERLDRAEGTKPYREESRALDPREVTIKPGWNVRDMTSPATREWIATLKASIAARGLDKPIAIRYERKTGAATLVDGQCRLTACRELWDEGNQVWVKSVVVEGDEAQLTIKGIVANANQTLTQWEIGTGCARLIAWGWTKGDIAVHICQSERYVTEALALHNAPLEAKAMLSAGEVTPGAVLHAVKEHGAEEGVKVLKAAVAARPTPPPPAQASIPGTAKPAKAPKPVARPKALSKRETALKAAPEPQQAAPKWDTLVDRNTLDRANTPITAPLPGRVIVSAEPANDHGKFYALAVAFIRAYRADPQDVTPHELDQMAEDAWHATGLKA
jgi:ParB-like chromosome segregation protein Spo0J